jgi:hypothetical protein
MARARGRGRLVIVVAGVLLLVGLTSAVAILRNGDDDPSPPLTVEWDGGEGNPPCVYDATAHAVDAKVIVKGKPARPGTVTVTVGAYADENTSVPVGSSSRSVQVEGTVRLPLALTIPVDKAPHVDEDGVAACALSWK